MDTTDNFIATGVLILTKGVRHLLTAKHVVKKFKDKDLWIAFNTKHQRIDKRFIKDIKNTFKVKWIFYPSDTTVDLAIMPFPKLPADEVKFVQSSLFLDISNIYETCDIFFLSFQPGVPSEDVIDPIIRGGIISRINKDKTFYVDGAAFPGNSGSPVFVKLSPFRREGGTISVGGDTLGGKFIGIIGEYVPYREVAISVQTGKPRIVFEENTGLSRVWSVDYINELINSQPFISQVKRLKKLIK